MTVKWTNYFLFSKDSRLTEGHLHSDTLLKTILNHNGNTAYCCYFDLEYESLKLEYWFNEYDSDGKKIYRYFRQGETPPNRGHFKPQITFTQYEGVARPALNLVSYDFDSENPEDALEDVRKFVQWLGVTDIGIFYSGSKGFHVLVPFEYFPLEVGADIVLQLKDQAKFLKESYPTLDDSIYNYNRKFRVPFTKHETTGLYKTWIPVEQIQELTIEEIQSRSAHRNAFNFIDDINIQNSVIRTALDVLIDLNENVKRKSYAIEKERAGTKEKPSKFEAFDGKLCIKKLLESRCDDVGRNNACMRIVNDYYRTGKTKEQCITDVFKWAASTGLPSQEVNTIINNIFDRGANYNFGCQDEIKSLYCSAKCAIWKKLDPDKRPVTVDMPERALKKADVELETVTRLLTGTFKAVYDDIKGCFSGGLLVKQGKEDLFYYDAGKWTHLSFPEIDRIKQRLNLINEGKLSSKHIESAFKMFLYYVPAVPNGVDMFSPDPHKANFKNGTLHLCKAHDSSYYLEFRQHNPLDYITHQIEHDYIEGDEKTNSMFDQMLESIFGHLTDKDERIKVIQEMYGAALIPAFPHLFYLYGEANSGKSTIIILLDRLLGGGNVSRVQPKDFNGFNLEVMVGKLVNMVTDVNTRRAIDDDVVKMIEDRAPITIRRKNRTDIQAPLPSVHIFGGNDLLTSYEGYSKAMQRRWSILKFDRAYEGPRNRDIVRDVLRHDSQGLINFAMIGLRRLVKNNGYFSEIESSRIELKEWATESDTVEQFLEAAKYSELDNPIVIHENAKIEKTILWNMFNEWQDKSGYRNQGNISRQVFYKRMTSKKFLEKKVMGVRYFSGLGESTVDTGSDITENKSYNNF